LWSLDYDFDAQIVAPVTYGSFGGMVDPNAVPLTAGVLHGVEVSRAEPCPDDPGPDCGQIVAAGCATFTP
jgi:hypothetical protein